MDPDKQFSFQEKFKYKLDNLMSRGGLYVFLALLLMFTIAFIVMGGLRVIIYLFFHDPNIEDHYNSSGMPSHKSLIQELLPN